MRPLNAACADSSRRTSTWICSRTVATASTLSMSPGSPRTASGISPIRSLICCSCSAALSRPVKPPMVSFERATDSILERQETAIDGGELGVERYVQEVPQGDEKRDCSDSAGGSHLVLHFENPTRRYRRCQRCTVASLMCSRPAVSVGGATPVERKQDTGSPGLTARRGRASQPPFKVPRSSGSILEALGRQHESDGTRSHFRHTAFVRRDVELDATIVAKYSAVAPVLDERSRWRSAAAVSLAIGYGRDALVSSATGLARETIRKARREIARRDEPSGRIRAPGAGRPRS